MGGDPAPPTVPPLTFAFPPASPNPFALATTSSYTLPNSGRVTLQLYNLSGRLVATILDRDEQPGVHQVPWQNDRLPSGIYFVRLQAGETTATQRVLLLR